MRRSGRSALTLILAILALVPRSGQALPADCPPNPVSAETLSSLPVAAKHCIPAADFTVDGRSLGFTDTYAVDWVRPGINLGPCSTSYMLVDDSGRFYLTQSAHCVYDVSGANFCVSTYAAMGSTHQIEGYGAPATLAWVSGEHMKQYGATPDECSSWDIAILRIPDSLKATAHPAIRHIGGPTGLADPMTIRHGTPAKGYGNSDDRGFVVELATRKDHGNAPIWPHVNQFSGTFVGNVLDEASCIPEVNEFTGDNCWNTEPYWHGNRAYFRYVPTKITGDSGSSDLLADGRAVGITSAINFATGMMASSLLYDTLLRIWFDTGVRYRLVTWDEWSPDTIETMDVP